MRHTAARLRLLPDCLPRHGPCGTSRPTPSSNGSGTVSRSSNGVMGSRTSASPSTSARAWPEGSLCQCFGSFSAVMRCLARVSFAFR